MANFVLDKSYWAKGTTAYAEGEVVKWHADNLSIDHVTAANDALAMGVITVALSAAAVQTGKAEASVRKMGIAHVLLGGNVSAGDKVMVTAAGRVVTATATNRVFGVAEEDGVSGALCNILLLPGAYNAVA